MFTYDTNAVLAYWYHRPLRARDAFRVMGEFVLRLKHRSPLFEPIYVATNRGWVALDTDLTNLEAQLVSRIDPEYGFINDNPKDLRFALTSFSATGFNSAFTDSRRETDQRVSLSIFCGQTELGHSISPNSIVLDVAPTVGTPALLRTLFEETIRFWRPADAAVTRMTVIEPLAQSVDEVRPGWLTYIADKAVADSVPADFVCEPFADGVLIHAAKCPGTADDPDYMARLFRLRDALRPQGWLTRRVELSERL
jgi:hypothetical protein